VSPAASLPRDRAACGGHGSASSPGVNRWYDEEHLPDVRHRFPKITSVRQYRATDGQDPRYLVVYQYNVASEDELNDLARADHSLRQEPWKLCDEAVGVVRQAHSAPLLADRASEPGRRSFSRARTA